MDGGDHRRRRADRPGVGPRADGPAVPAALPDGGRHRHDRGRQDPARQPARAAYLRRRRGRGRLRGDGAPDPPLAPDAGLPLPGGAGRQRGDAARRPRRGLPRRAGRRGDPRGRQRPRHARGVWPAPPARRPPPARSSSPRSSRTGRSRRTGSPRWPSAATSRSGSSSPSPRPTCTPTSWTTSCAYYSPGSGSPFGDKIDELRALAGGAKLSVDVLPVSSQGGDRKSAVSAKEASAMVDALAARLAQLSGHV